MKYKVVKLEADSDGIVDIPDRCIPMRYDIMTIYEAGSGMKSFRELTVLQPVEGNEQCSVCHKMTTTLKVGIDSICMTCIDKMYEKVKGSHK